MAEDGRAARLRRRRARRRRILAAGVGVVVVGGGGAAAVAATSGGGAGKRYATIGRASVTEVVESSGTVVSSEKVTPSFPVSGTVRAIDVTVGESVRKGQPLARLDTTSLQDSVDSAQLTLANARQQLAADQSGQTSTGSAGGSTTGGTGLSTNTAGYTALTATRSVDGAGSASGGTGAAGDQAALIAQIRAAQPKVLAAQQAVDAGEAAVDAAQHTVDADVTQNTILRNAQKLACAADGDGTSTGPSTDACTSARADYENFADILAADAHALDTKIATQDTAVQQLDAAIGTLDKLLARLSASGSGSGTGSGSGSGSHSGTGTGRTGSGRSTGGTGAATRSGGTGSTTRSTGSSQSSGQPASAARLAADQASIDSAQAQLTAAEQNLAAATLRSPIAGKVAAIGLTAGASASGQSITIIGTGIQKVSTSVPLAQVTLVKAGQPVAVAADGVASGLHGTVTSVGILSSTSGSTTTFPVTVQLAAGSPKLYDGAGADVRITTGSAHDVVAVPNSAIHSGFRGTHTVTVLQGAKTSTVPVTLGVAGSALSEVKSGLKVGDRVLVADYATSVPTSTSTTNGNLTRFLGGFGGGFGGGGGNRAGFTGNR